MIYLDTSEHNLQSSRICFDGSLTVKEKTYNITFGDGSVVVKQCEVAAAKSDAVAALVIHKPTNMVWLSRQYRPTIGRWLITIPTGYVEGDEEYESAISRTVQEEIGEKPKYISLMMDLYSAPEWSDQYNRIYLCYVDNIPDSQKTYGVKAEGKSITAIGISIDKFIAHAGDLGAAQTILAAQWLAINRRKLNL